MQDNLPMWISENPGLIEELKNKPTLEQMLRKIRYTPPNQKVTEEQWRQIQDRFEQ